MNDLLYFGMDGECERAKFRILIAEKFPNAKLTDDDDWLKGARLSVDLPQEQELDYLAWALSEGCFHISLMIQLMSRDPEKHKTVYKALDLAQEQYPEAFKKEVSNDNHSS